MVGRSIVDISDLGGILTEARRAKVSIVLVWPSRMQLWPASQEMPCRHLATEFEDNTIIHVKGVLKNLHQPTVRIIITQR